MLQNFYDVNKMYRAKASQFSGKCRARVLAYTWTGEMCKRIVYSSCGDTENVFYSKKRCLERK